MDDQQLYDLIAKSLSGGMTSEEQAEFDNSLHKNPDNLKAYKTLQKQWLVGGKLKLNLDVNTEESWNKFTQLRGGQSVKKNNSWPTILKVAAMILVTIGISFYNVTVTENKSIRYATGDNEMLEVVLPDSSKIWLNESTIITLASNFNDTKREIDLNGEAYFEINRDEKRPFIITSGETTTEVLGTSFNIDARQSKAEVSINVVSGKVSFSHLENELILIKGNAAVFHKEKLSLTQTEGGQNNLAWHSKKLVFEDQSLETVISVLEDYFQREINLMTTTASSCLFTGEFKDPKIDEVLEVIALTLDLKIEHKEHNYLLSGTGCANN